jgi:hypothetical protein
MNGHLAEYERAYNAWIKTGKKKHIIHAFMSMATTGKVTANCCMALSCFTCCCCTPCGQASYEMGESMDIWKKNMTTAYADVPLEKVDNVFEMAIQVLGQVKGQVASYQKMMSDQMVEARMAGNAKSYSDQSFHMSTFHITYGNDQWLKKMYDGLYSSVCYGSQYQDKVINLTHDQQQILIAAMPLFCMAAAVTVTSRVHTFNPVTCDIIRRVIMSF